MFDFVRRNDCYCIENIYCVFLDFAIVQQGDFAKREGHELVYAHFVCVVQ